MHMQLAGRHAAKPADEASDQSAVQERAGKIVARLGERLQHVGADWRLIGPSPYHREQLLQPAQILQVAQLPDLSVHARPSRRPVTSEPACTPAAATIASANAGAIPSGRRTARNASPGIRSGLRVMVAAEKAAVAASIEAIQVERWAVHA